MKRFAAKLLFQFRVDLGKDSGMRRLCEERIINFLARSPREALRKAKRHGQQSEHAYKNSDGNTVFIEFVGIIAMMHLGLEAGPEEAWYEIRERVLPMERRAVLIPDDAAHLTRLKYQTGG